MNRHLYLHVILLLVALLKASTGSAAEVITLNDGWTFYKGFQASSHQMLKIQLPHTWNAADGMYGNTDYYRGLCTYTRKLLLPETYNGKRIFLKIGAAQTVADIFVDNKFVMQHRGGYTAFTAELTNFLTPGKESTLDIRVSNAQTMDIAPICGDFNIYGGLSRGVELWVTEDVCITPDYYASSGVFFTQSEVSEQRAYLKVEALLSARNNTQLEGCSIEVQLWNNNKIIWQQTTNKLNTDNRMSVEGWVDKPHLWDGLNDPFLYKGVVILKKNNCEIDRREELIGFRYYMADPEKGFFLNGKPYRLNGVNRHQDRAERASAFYDEDHDEDLALILEMGCNAVRLSHYPQAKYLHKQMDRLGLIAWPEIPFVNVYVNNPAYDENLRQQLKELILQNYNHPCILFWGLFNEISSYWLDRPSKMVAELNKLAHQLDPQRLTMGASNQNDDFNGFTDLIAFNKYFGWYGSDLSEMERWIDQEHAAHPERKMGMSEYGAGGCIYQQAEELKQPEPWGQWHPENWQTYHHIETWKQLKEKEFMWCNFIWCMFDFSAAGRREGTVMGRNDKGLVTYDRQTKKDAFYFYKANWNNKESFIYIAEKRHKVRSKHQTTILAFGTCQEAELWVNGKLVGKQKPDKVKVFRWENVKLQPGKNEIRVKGNKSIEDKCIWIVK